MAASKPPGLRLSRQPGLATVLVVLAAGVLYFLEHSALPYYASFDLATSGRGAGDSSPTWPAG